MTTAERATELADFLCQVNPGIYHATESVKAALDAAVSEEREACAKLAEEKYEERMIGYGAGISIAKEIRKRGGQ